MNNLSKFSLRLKELMDERGLNAPALAKILGTDRTNITRYLRGERAPQYDGFIKMLEYFECSADYLLGLTDITRDGVKFSTPPPFCERLREVIKFCGSSQYKLEYEKGFSGSAIYNWLTGKKLPSVENIIALAKSLDCTVDFLLGREN